MSKSVEEEYMAEVAKSAESSSVEDLEMQKKLDEISAYVNFIKLQVAGLLPKAITLRDCMNNAFEDVADDSVDILDKYNRMDIMSDLAEMELNIHSLLYGPMTEK